MWVETATQGGRRSSAAWRKGEEDAARHRQETREREANETRKSYPTMYNLRNDENWSINS